MNYERKGAGWYTYTVRHTATNRILCGAQCNIKVPSKPKAARNAPAMAAIEAGIRAHAIQTIDKHVKRRLDNSDAFSEGRTGDVVGEDTLPGLPPKRRDELLQKGRIKIPAELPQKLIRDAYDTALKTTALPEVAEKAALQAGLKLLIGATDAQVLKIAQRKAHLEGDSENGIRYVEGIL